MVNYRNPKVPLVFGNSHVCFQFRVSSLGVPGLTPGVGPWAWVGDPSYGAPMV